MDNFSWIINELGQTYLINNFKLQRILIATKAALTVHKFDLKILQILQHCASRL